MTNSEFSNEFDVFYNSITSNSAPGLDEYEKSVFLTKAQDDILVEHFNPIIDQTDRGYDGTVKRQYDFSMLMKTVTLSPEASLPMSVSPIDRRSVLFSLPKDFFLSINEIIDERGGTQYSVVPINYGEYQRLMLKPYAYPPRKMVWRMITNHYSDKTIVEVIGRFKNLALLYNIRYVRRPRPIILTDLTGTETSINGIEVETTCELPSVMHRDILERAVTLAKLAYQAGTTQTIASQQGNKQRQQQE